jgi:hypothetical protein
MLFFYFKLLYFRLHWILFPAALESGLVFPSRLENAERCWLRLPFQTAHLANLLKQPAKFAVPPT